MCYLWMLYNESQVRNDNAKMGLGEPNIFRGATRQSGAPEIFPSTASYIDKFPKSPRSYCRYLQGRKLRKNSIISSILVLMNRDSS